MKLAELFDNHLEESLNASLPYRRENEHRYKIELSETDSLFVSIYQKTIQRYNCVSVLFRDPSSIETRLSNFFNGPRAIRVLSTIINIFTNIDFEILALVPDDIDVEVENKKTRLYSTVLLRLVRLGRITWHTQLNFPEFTKPVLVALHGDGAGLSEDEISQIVKRFGIEKLSP